MKMKRYPYTLPIISGRNRKLGKIEEHWIGLLLNRQDWLTFWRDDSPKTTKKQLARIIPLLTRRVAQAKAQITRVRKQAAARGDKVQRLTQMLAETWTQP